MGGRKEGRWASRGLGRAGVALMVATVALGLYQALWA